MIVEININLSTFKYFFKNCPSNTINTRYNRLYYIYNKNGWGEGFLFEKQTFESLAGDTP